MSTSGSAIRYRRDRKLQGGGNQKLQYVDDILRSHTREVDGGFPETARAPDVPGDWVEHSVDHAQSEEEEGE